MQPLHVGILILAIVVAVVVVVLVLRRTRRELPAAAEEAGRPEEPELEEPGPEVADDGAAAPASRQPAPPEPGPGIEPGPEPRVEVKPQVEVKPRVEVKPQVEPRHEAPPEPVAREVDDGKERIRSIRRGLKATRGGFISRLRSLFAGKTDLDADLADRIEEVFITSDVGARTAQQFIEKLKGALSTEELCDPTRVWAFVKEEARRVLSHEGQVPAVPGEGPLTILVLGVNGVGKTTTIGKLAARYRQQGKRVLLGAADTFRAAAVEQLEIWGGRIDSPVVKGKEGADPSSVVFDALGRASQESFDVVIVDTAGRLHTKVPLMEELKKLRRVMAKAQPGAPHEVLLVLDATTGQNGVMQARTFLESLEVTGIVLTKLDGTAKGGVILGIGSELHIPVRYIGVGEGVDDLRPFDPDEFIEALFDEIDDEEAAA